MLMKFPAAARNFFPVIESTGEKFMELSSLSYIWHIKEHWNIVNYSWNMRAGSCGFYR